MPRYESEPESPISELIATLNDKMKPISTRGIAASQLGAWKNKEVIPHILKILRKDEDHPNVLMRSYRAIYDIHQRLKPKSYLAPKVKKLAA